MRYVSSVDIPLPCLDLDSMETTTSDDFSRSSSEKVKVSDVERSCLEIPFSSQVDPLLTKAANKGDEPVNLDLTMTSAFCKRRGEIMENKPDFMPGNGKQPDSSISALLFESHGDEKWQSSSFNSASMSTVHEHANKSEQSSFRIASSLCSSDSESESSHATTIRGSSESSLHTVHDELGISAFSCAYPNAPSTSSQLDDCGKYSKSKGDSFDEGFIVNAKKASDNENGEENTPSRIPVVAETADRLSESPEEASPAGSRGHVSRSATFDLQLETDPQTDPTDTTGQSKANLVLPERYQKMLRKTGSHGNSSSLQISEQQDLTSREKDLGAALAWIRQQMVEMKEQDQVLMRRFLELRTSILQLRCMYDVLGSTSDLSSMDGSSASLNELRKSVPRMRSLLRTESDAMMSGGTYKATSSFSLPCSPQLSRLKW